MRNWTNMQTSESHATRIMLRQAKEAVAEATQILRDFYSNLGPALVQIRRGWYRCA